MGCNVSRLDANGVTLPARLRPLFLQRLEEIKARRRAGRPLKGSTPSKKELLSQDKNEEDNASHHHHSSNPSKSIAYSLEGSIEKPEQPKGKEPLELKEEAPNKEIGVAKTIGNNDDMKHKVVKEGSPRGKGENDTDAKAKIDQDAFTDADEDEEDDDDDDDDERMIGYEDDEAFPGSPSFRVYFEDNGEDSHNDIGKIGALKETVPSDVGVPSKESSVEKKVKRGRKRRSFRKVLPKGGQAAVKNLLKVKSCYTSSHSSHDHAHLLTGKTTT
ncbi:hypothetical protein Pfo_011744 [Paulownia fortunei]|nr:hypothetical protein Pfo_011744 [Paulownia fortunei]